MAHVEVALIYGCRFVNQNRCSIFQPVASRDAIIHSFFPPILHFKVIDPINKLLDTVEFDSVFYSLDWHPSDHVSFIDNIKQRPIHPTSPVRFSFFV